MQPQKPIELKKISDVVWEIPKTGNMKVPCRVFASEKLLEKMKWHGVAQVEFKKDKEGTLRLMEVNPKFWGTLDLSIKAGINFPHLLYKMTIEGDVEPCFQYKTNFQIWWISAHFPQLFFAFMRNRKQILSALTDPSKKKVIDADLGDVKPHILQFIEGFSRITGYGNMLEHPLSR